MTTVADVLRTAREVTDAGLLYRESSGYFSVQQADPYPPGHFGRSWIESCGVGTAFVLHRAGLRVPDVPPYHAMQYAPALRRYANSTPRVGAVGVMNWKPGDGVLDHITLIVGGEDVDGDGFVHGAVDVWEVNWDRTRTGWTARGVPRYARHPARLFEVCVMPGYAPEPTTPVAPAPVPLRRHPPRGDGMTTLHKVPTNAARHGDPDAAHNTFISDVAGVRWYNPAQVNQVDDAAVQWHTREGWAAWFDNYCRAWHGCTAAVFLTGGCDCPICKR